MWRDVRVGADGELDGEEETCNDERKGKGAGEVFLEQDVHEGPDFDQDAHRIEGIEQP